MRRLALATGIALVVAAPLAAQDPTPVDRADIELAAYVNEDLSFYGDIPSLAAARTMVAESSWGRCMTDARVRRFLAPIFDNLDKTADSTFDLLGFDVRSLRGVFTGRAQVAMRETWLRRRALTQAAFLLRAPGLREFAQPLIEASELEEVQIGRHLAYRIDIDVDEVPDFGPSAILVMFEKHVLLTNSMRWATAIVGDKPLEEKSFAKTAAFGELPTTAAIRMWTDPGQPFRVDEKRYSKAVADIRAAAATRFWGLMGIQPSVGTVTLEDGRFFERYSGAVPEADTLAATHSATATGFTLLGRVSADASCVVASRVAVPAFLRALHAYVDTGTHADDLEANFSDEDFVEFITEVLDRCHDSEIFLRMADGLGDEIVATATTPRSGFVPTVIVRIAVADRTKLVQALDEGVAKLLGEDGTLEKKSGGLYVLRFGRLPVPLVLAVGDDELVIGLNAGAVRTAMRPPARALTADARFRAAMATVGAGDLQTASSVGYVDVPRWVEFGYEALIPLIDMFGDEIDLDPGDAPGAAHVAELFAPTAAASRVVDGRWVVEFRGPLAPVSVLTSLGVASFELIDRVTTKAK